LEIENFEDFVSCDEDIAVCDSDENVEMMDSVSEMDDDSDDDNTHDTQVPSARDVFAAIKTLRTYSYYSTKTSIITPSLLESLEKEVLNAQAEKKKQQCITNYFKQN
jgi:hypothetical protein